MATTPKTPEQLKELLEEWKKVLEEGGFKIQGVDPEQMAAATVMVDKIRLLNAALKKNNNHYLSLSKRFANMAKDSENRTEQEKKNLKEQSKEYRKMHNEVTRFRNSQQSLFKNTSGHVKEAHKHIKVVSVDVKKFTNAVKASDLALAESSRRLIEARKGVVEADRGKVAGQAITPAIQDAIKDLPEMIQGATGNLKDALSTEMAIAAAFGGKGFILGMQAELASMPDKLDTGLRSLGKKTGLTIGEGFEDVFIGAIDPVEKLGTAVGGLNQPMTDIGLTAEESSKALAALTDNAAFFRQSFIANNKATAIFTAQQVAALTKIGVGAETSANSMNIFTKALKQPASVANKSVMSLVNMADSLQINVGQAIQDFNAEMGNLAQFGDRAIEVFADLEAQAVATGVKVGTLATYAKGLDTFKGAASVAQRFNAVLGGTFVSVTDLVHADPSEKINLMREAMARAGIDFQTASRRMKMVIASAAGFADVQTAAQVFGSQDDFARAQRGMKTSAMSQADFKQKIEATMTRAEIAKKGFSSLAGGMQQYVNITRKMAIDVSKMTTDLFATAQEGADNSFESVVKFTAAFKTIGTVLNVIGKGKSAKMAITGAATFGGALVDELTPGDGANAAPAVNRAKKRGGGSPQTPPKRAAMVVPTKDEETLKEAQMQTGILNRMVSAIEANPDLLPALAALGTALRAAGVSGPTAGTPVPDPMGITGRAPTGTRPV